MSSNTVFVDTSDFKPLIEKVGGLSDEVCKTADKALANLGAEGRKVLGRKEKAAGFQFGIAQSKWKSSKSGGKWYDDTVFSKFNPTHGWYQGSDGTRMIGFNYENKAYQKYGKNSAQRTLRGRLSAISKGYVYSLMANLFGKPVSYSVDSPYFKNIGQREYGRWQAGQTRPARLTMTAADIEPAIAPAMERTRQDIAKIIRKFDQK